MALDLFWRSNIQPNVMSAAVSLACFYWPKVKCFANHVTSYTLPETSIYAPENRPSQKESSLPTMHFQERTVSFREGNILPNVYLLLSVQKSVSTSVKSQEKKLVRSVLGGNFKHFLCSPLGFHDPMGLVSTTGVSTSNGHLPRGGSWCIFSKWVERNVYFYIQVKIQAHICFIDMYMFLIY